MVKQPERRHRNQAQSRSSWCTHFEAKAAWDAGATEAEMKDILRDIRHAQWRWDFSIASHGVQMHARKWRCMLGTALDKAADARASWHACWPPGDQPRDRHSWHLQQGEGAQAALGMDMKQMNSDKAQFLKTSVPAWDAEAKAARTARTMKRACGPCSVGPPAGWSFLWVI